MDKSSIHGMPTGFFRTLGRLVILLGVEWRLVLLGLCLMIAASLATVIGPRIIAYLIDNTLTTGDNQKLFVILSIYAATELLRLISTAGHMYSFSVAGQRVMQTLRLQLYERFMQLPQSYFAKNPTGQIVTRLTNDITVIGQVFTAGVVLIIEKCITVLVIAIGLLTLDTRLAALALIPYSVFLIASIFISGWVHRLYRRLYAQLERFNTYLAEVLGGIQVIHLFSAEEHHLKDFRSVNFDLARSQRDSRLSFAVLHPLVTVVTGTSMSLLIWYGGGMVHAGTLKLGTLVACLSYVIWLMWPLIHIIEKWSIFLSGISAAERIFECFDWESDEELKDLHLSVPTTHSMRGEITFKNVSFAYDSAIPAVKDLSFTIKPGEKVGIIGPSGSGKSTLLSLLRRFYDPQFGQILIDGVDIRTLNKRSLRRSLGLVQQDIFLFHGNVEDNINLWDTESSLSQDLINSLLPSGFDLKKAIAERGVNLSVGEKQLISFLRCLISKPRIWLLDEASANLDQESEGKMFELLNTHAKEQTVISIAHRISTVREADKILVLHKGHLIEQGNHSSLMKQKGFYAKLFKLQEVSQ